MTLSADRICADMRSLRFRSFQMGAIAEIGRPVVPTRVLAGIVVPNTPIVSRAIEFARENSKPYLFNHSMRSWLFAEAWRN